jgi:AcrR family transcriptional regulator
MARPREHNEETREALRDAALRLFAEEGAEAVSVRSVAAEVGTTTRAVYSLFGSQDALLIDALGSRAYRILEDGLEAQVETDDPVRDLIEASIEVFRRFVLEHPDLFRVTFQRQVPGFEPGPELLEARRTSYERLAAKIARLEPLGALGDLSVDEALLQFQGLCEGLGNFEMRGDTMRILPEGGEEQAWRSAFTTLVRGFSHRS